MLAITSIETHETLERWQFDIHTEDDPDKLPPLPGGPPKPKTKAKAKTEKEVQGEIREIMKQITSSVTFLPILEEPCTSSGQQSDKADGQGTFTLLAYTSTSPDTAIPATWDDADPHLIDRGQVEQVRLRSFSTNVHSLEVSDLSVVDNFADTR